LEPGQTRDLHPEQDNFEFGNANIVGTTDAKWQVFGCRQYPLDGVFHPIAEFFGRLVKTGGSSAPERPLEHQK
jgi:hypothetical protein